MLNNDIMKLDLSAYNLPAIGTKHIKTLLEIRNDLSYSVIIEKYMNLSKVFYSIYKFLYRQIDNVQINNELSCDFNINNETSIQNLANSDLALEKCYYLDSKIVYMIYDTITYNYTIKNNEGYDIITLIDYYDTIINIDYSDKDEGYFLTELIRVIVNSLILILTRILYRIIENDTSNIANNDVFNKILFILEKHKSSKMYKKTNIIYYYNILYSVEYTIPLLIIQHMLGIKSENNFFIFTDYCEYKIDDIKMNAVKNIVKRMLKCNIIKSDFTNEIVEYIKKIGINMIEESTKSRLDDKYIEYWYVLTTLLNENTPRNQRNVNKKKKK